MELNNLEDMNVPWNHFLTDKRVPIGTTLVPGAYVTKDKNDKRWIIVPPEEYLCNDKKYDEFKSILYDIIIDYNLSKGEKT